MVRCLPIFLAVLLAVGCTKDKKNAGAPTGPVPVTVTPKPAAKGPDRKDIVILTAVAAEQVKKILKGEGGKYRFLRVRVTDDLERKVDIDIEADPANDYLGESRGIEIAVDRKSAALLPKGIQLDYSAQDGGFLFIAGEYEASPPDTSRTLIEARKGFQTKLARKVSDKDPAPKPPAELFQLIQYEAPKGKSAAYLTPDPKDGKKHPAIVWITGGDCNSIDEGSWAKSPASNDQSARAYREAGIIMMFPSLRGGNGNPGVKEGFFGEVDDVLAAADHLAKQPYVDPDRIYLGGHSTGGTVVLLTAECSKRFRAVFSFGPADNPAGYGPQYCPFDLVNPIESELRAPGRWLHCIQSPVFVIEGSEQGNATSLRTMARTTKNPQVKFFEVSGANHFDVLSPTNRLIAEKILLDTGKTCNLAFTEKELNRPFKK